MAQDEQIKRLYTITDPYMIEFAKDTLNNLLTDMPSFLARDPLFTPIYRNSLLAMVQAAEDCDDEETVDAQKMQLTAIVDDKMELCRRLFQDSKRDITNAFPTDSGKRKEFKFEQYMTVRRNQPLMIEWMRDFHKACVKYAPQLDAVNFDTTKRAAVLSLANDLDTANQNQNAFINSEPTITRDRIEKHNLVWTKITDICTVGKGIFRDNWAKYKLYLLPASEEATEEFSLTGTVKDAVTNNPIQGATVQVMPAGEEVQTDSNGRYGIAGLDPGGAMVQFSSPNHVPQTQATTIGDETVRLNVSLMPSGPVPPITPPMPPMP